MKNIFLCLFVLISCKGKDNNRNTTLYYSLTSEGASQPDCYIVMASNLTNNKRVDSFYKFRFDGNNYPFYTCYYKEYIVENDSVLVTVFNGRKNYFTKFLEEKCDTTYYGSRAIKQVVNCYLGDVGINNNDSLISSHHKKTKVFGAHGSDRKNSYYDKNMFLIREENDDPMGFGKYTVERVRHVPFKVSLNYECN